MNIKYKVEFFTDWHCGSGLGAGADVDALVVKDSNGLPFLPGKTVKGLLREAVEDILQFRSAADPALDERLRKLLVDAFGYFDGKSDSDGVRSTMTRGSAFFTNAELSETERCAIMAATLQSYLYRIVSSTAIDDEGIAVDHSLRRIETTVPCKLEGEIIGLPDDEDFLRVVTDALRYVKRLGQNRNRGLGRCAFSLAVCPTSKEA